LDNNNSKGDSEIFAIDYAIRNSKIIEPIDFIIKITGRYFISELQDYVIHNDLKKYDCLTQQDKDRCEMVGCSYNLFNFIFNPKINCPHRGHIESIWKQRASLYKNTLTCKLFSIEKTIRGGDNSYFNTI
tara:strand:+ start:4581 stop:4970 length:390 start_codon:yes stop_codon:yes gene_type:complete